MVQLRSGVKKAGGELDGTATLDSLVAKTRRSSNQKKVVQNETHKRKTSQVNKSSSSLDENNTHGKNNRIGMQMVSKSAGRGGGLCDTTYTQKSSLMDEIVNAKSMKDDSDLQEKWKLSIL